MQSIQHIHLTPRDFQPKRGERLNKEPKILKNPSQETESDSLLKPNSSTHPLLSFKSILDILPGSTHSATEAKFKKSAGLEIYKKKMRGMPTQPKTSDHHSPENSIEIDRTPRFILKSYHNLTPADISSRIDIEL